MKLTFSRQIFEKYSNIKFHENPSKGAELFLADGRTDMMKLKVTFLNFANAPESGEGKFVPLLNQQPLHN
jgi:hypothetical protein